MSTCITTTLSSSCAGLCHRRVLDIVVVMCWTLSSSSCAGLCRHRHAGLCCRRHAGLCRRRHAGQFFSTPTSCVSYHSFDSNGSDNASSDPYDYCEVGRRVMTGKPSTPDGLPKKRKFAMPSSKPGREADAVCAQAAFILKR
jgi:hypothetical protein